MRSLTSDAGAFAFMAPRMAPNMDSSSDTLAEDIWDPIAASIPFPSKRLKYASDTVALASSALPSAYASLPLLKAASISLTTLFHLLSAAMAQETIKNRDADIMNTIRLNRTITSLDVIIESDYHF